MPGFGWSYPAGCSGPPCDAGEDLPDDCPTCGEPNFDDDLEPVCPEAPGYCSAECRDTGLEHERLAAEAEAEALQDEEEFWTAHEAAYQAAPGRKERDERAWLL